jgi:hypothetical protein
MNTNLLNALKEIVSRYGGVETLSDARRVKALLADLAAAEPKAQKNTLTACLERRFAALLQDVPARERGAAKSSLAERLNREEGLDIALCADTLDLLEAALFWSVSPKPEPKATEAPGTSAPQKPEEALYKISFNYQKSGPYNMAQLLRRVRNGKITKDHWICPVGASEWTPVTTIEALKGPIEAREKAEAERRAAAEKAAAEQAEAGSQHQPAPPPQDEVPVNDPEKEAEKKPKLPVTRYVMCFVLANFVMSWLWAETDDFVLSLLPTIGIFWALNAICKKIFGKPGE